MKLNLDMPLAVVAHDAGAANHILAWLREDDRLDEVRPFMQGPAERLWRQAFPAWPICGDLDVALSDARVVISGTGWASDVEHEARRLARERGIPSIAVIDHWVNYAERFIRHHEQIWPDEFWVVDEYALSMAEKLFQGKPVRLMPNRYLESQVREVAPIPAVSPELLYVLEPARSDWGRGVQGEFQALDYFISRLPLLDLPADTVIRLRPHPSDAVGKYQDWVDAHPSLRIVMDDAAQISSALSRARWVVGCESFALVLALNAGRQVYCTLPPWAPACRLPHAGLIYLSKIG